MVDVIGPYSNRQALVEALLEYAHPRGLEKNLDQLQAILARAQKNTPRQLRLSTVRNVRRRLGGEVLVAIVSQYVAGSTTTQLMAKYKLSKSAVLKILKDAKVPMRRQPLTEQQVRQARQLRATGMSIAEVADKLKLARESVRRSLM